MVGFWTAAGLSIAEIVCELHAMGETVTDRTVSNDREELEQVYESIRDGSLRPPAMICSDEIPALTFHACHRSGADARAGDRAFPIG